MGCDWHPFLERRTATGWEPLWEPVLDEYWYERILDDNEDVGDLLSFSADPKVQAETLLNYFTSMSHDEIMRRFGDDPRVVWQWREHSYRTELGTIGFKCRDYAWFGRLSGIRSYGSHQMFTPKPLPSDMSLRVKNEWIRGEGDWHMPGCLMVSEILASERYDISQIRWLRDNVPDPENTRLIFWYDN
ncbi:unnamed protein product [Sphagnum tenellum]